MQAGDPTMLLPDHWDVKNPLEPIDILGDTFVKHSIRDICDKNCLLDIVQRKIKDRPALESFVTSSLSCAGIFLRLKSIKLTSPESDDLT